MTWRILYWLIVISIYLAVAVHLLRDAIPGSIDGGGPTPGFYWSKRIPSPNMAEYNRNHIYYDRLFAIPYYVGALVVTILGCGISPLIAGRVGPRHNPARAAIITFGLLIVCGALSDEITAASPWRGPTLLRGFSFKPYQITAVSKVYILPAMMTWAVTSGWSFVQRRDP